MRQKVIANKETKKDKVIDNSLQIIAKWNSSMHIIVVNIFSHHLESNKLKIHVYCTLIYLLRNSLLVLYWICSSTIHKVMSSFLTTCTPFIVCCYHNLSYDVKARLMSCQTQHNQICISSINAVALVRWIALRTSLLPYKIHNFMFSFSWTVWIWKYN